MFFNGLENRMCMRAVYLLTNSLSDYIDFADTDVPSSFNIFHLLRIVIHFL